MALFEDNGLVLKILWMLTLLSLRPGQSAVGLAVPGCQKGSTAVLTRANRPHTTGLKRYSSATLSTTTCSQRQQVAQAVLDYVASGSSAQKQWLHMDSNLIGTSKALNQTSRTSTISPAHNKSHRPDGTAKRIPLHQYIHHLPTPPAPSAWWQLCEATGSKGLAGLQSGIEQQQLLLPDMQGAAAAHCQLGRHPWAYTFSNPALAAYVASLFYCITAGRAAAAKRLGAPAPQLDRFDLFHGHVFRAWDCNNSSSISNKPVQINSNSSGMGIRSSGNRRLNKAPNLTMPSSHLQEPFAAGASRSYSGVHSSSCQVGILFHAAEFPAYDQELFPINLGHCQVNSTCTYHERSMDLRNILWWKGQLAVLDVGPQSPLHDLLLHEGTEPLRTLYEEDFGKPVADLLLLKETRRRRRTLVAEQRRLQQLYGRLAAGTSSRLVQTAAEQAQEIGVYVSY